MHSYNEFIWHIGLLIIFIQLNVYGFKIKSVQIYDDAIQ